MTLRPAIFLDRDGTIIHEVGYLSNPDQVQLLTGAASAIAKWNRCGIPVIVATNQAGVARGYFPEARVVEIHRRLDELLAEHNAKVDAYFICPHHPTEGKPPYRSECKCRKPQPGLLVEGASQFGINLPDSIMIGDKLSDLEAGAAAGCGTILVRTGYGITAEKELASKPLRLIAVVDTLLEAERIIASR